MLRLLIDKKKRFIDKFYTICRNESSRVSFIWNLDILFHSYK